MELETRRFYERAMERISDVSIRQLLGELAATEREHYARATTLEKELLTPETRQAEDEAARQLFVLQIVQPGLAGLMDGSVSTLAPLFAAAFATHNSHDAFLVGLAASVGAGISMGFAEALSDDGSLTGRGHPWVRGIVCGLMTTAGGLGHTLPFLVPNFAAAMTLRRSSSSSSLASSAGFATTTWTRPSCRPRSRWSWAVFWCFSPDCSSAARRLADRVLFGFVFVFDPQRAPSEHDL